MPKRTHEPAAASLEPGQAVRAPLTVAIEECEQLYKALKWAANTQGMPKVKDRHLNEAREHIVKIVEQIGTGE